MNTTQPKRAYHISPFLVMRIANKIRLRPMMLRIAFEAGLYDTRTFETVPRAVEGAATLVAAGAILAERAAAEGHFTVASAGAAAATIITLAGVFVFTRTFRAATAATQNHIIEALKTDTLTSVGKVIGGKRIWEESDMYLLGKGIDSMTDYINKYSDNIINAPSMTQMDEKFKSDLSDENAVTVAEAEKLLSKKRAEMLVEQQILKTQMELTRDKLDRTIDFLDKTELLCGRDKTIDYINERIEIAEDNLRSVGILSPDVCLRRMPKHPVRFPAR